MPAAGFLPLPGGKEWREARQPLLAAMQQIPRGERVGELLEAFGLSASREGIGTLLEVDALLTHAVGQPMMLIEADAGGERQVGTDADKHPPPLPVIDIEVVLDDPAVGDLKMPAVDFAVTDRRHDACGFARLENDCDGIGACPFEVGIDEVVAAALGRLHNRDVPPFRPSFQPALKLLGYVAQRRPAHRIKLPVSVEEADDTLRLLERLNQTVQQDAIKATIMPSNAVPVMLVEGVHEQPPADASSADNAAHSPPSRNLQDEGISRAKPLASWLEKLV